MASFHFELVSPERLLYAGEVESVVVPGSEGQFTVMRDHAPFMSTMKPGVVEVIESASKSQRLFVRGGFADVSAAGLTILAEQAIPVEDLSAERIDAEIRNAEEDLSDAQSDEGKRAAAEKIAQLREARAALGL
ncbi:MAG: F0F1 ATP synthase subunit epsilon [Beijerinckiaceae bacterium]